MRSAARSVGVRTTLRPGASESTRLKSRRRCTGAASQRSSTPAAGAATVTYEKMTEPVLFEIVEDGTAPEAGLERLADRVEALGGLLTIGAEPGRGTRVAGALPLSRWR